MKKKNFSLRPDGWTGNDEWKFNTLWETFPPRCGRKNGKAYAREIYKQISPGEEMFETMLTAIRVQKVSIAWRKDNGQWIPDLSAWLNQQRWEDEVIL